MSRTELLLTRHVLEAHVNVTSWDSSAWNAIPTPKAELESFLILRALFFSINVRLDCNV